MVQWAGAKGQVKVTKNTLTCGVPPGKSPTENKNFLFDFDFRTRFISRGFEQLSSSIA